MEQKPFKEQFRYWSIHCGCTALPSFFIALKTFNSVSAILAMFCGVATFIVAFTFITSAPFYKNAQIGLIGKSIKLGAKIRMIISLASIPLVAAMYSEPPHPAIMFAPDFWFGFAAVMILFYGLNLLGFHIDLETTQNFFIIYGLTVIEGLLISISLIFIAFIALIISNRKRNTQRIPQDYFPK